MHDVLYISLCCATTAKTSLFILIILKKNSMVFLSAELVS